MCWTRQSSCWPHCEDSAANEREEEERENKDGKCFGLFSVSCACVSVFAVLRQHAHPRVIVVGVVGTKEQSALLRLNGDAVLLAGAGEGGDLFDVELVEGAAGFGVGVVGEVVVGSVYKPPALPRLDLGALLEEKALLEDSAGVELDLALVGHVPQRPDHVDLAPQLPRGQAAVAHQRSHEVGGLVAAGLGQRDDALPHLVLAVPHGQADVLEGQKGPGAEHGLELGHGRVLPAGVAAFAGGALALLVALGEGRVEGHEGGLAVRRDEGEVAALQLGDGDVAGPAGMEDVGQQRVPQEGAPHRVMVAGLQLVTAVVASGQGLPSAVAAVQNAVAIAGRAHLLFAELHGAPVIAVGRAEGDGRFVPQVKGLELTTGLHQLVGLQQSLHIPVLGPLDHLRQRRQRRERERRERQRRDRDKEERETKPGLDQQ